MKFIVNAGFSSWSQEFLWINMWWGEHSTKTSPPSPFRRVNAKSSSLNDPTLSLVLFYWQVTRLRLLGDQVHSTRIAFVEFAMVSYDVDVIENSWNCIKFMKLMASVVTHTHTHTLLCNKSTILEACSAFNFAGLHKLSLMNKIILSSVFFTHNNSWHSVNMSVFSWYWFEWPAIGFVFMFFFIFKSRSFGGREYGSYLDYFDFNFLLWIFVLPIWRYK
jgi:hypothetical protein